MKNKEEQLFYKLDSTNKSGYLNENFRFFHLKDTKSREFDYHYHDFHKIVIPFTGDITYYIEGKAYYLKPWDMLLVARHDIHKPVIQTDAPYERIVIWIKTDYLANISPDKDSLDACFLLAKEKNTHLLQSSKNDRIQLQTILQHLETALHSEDFASHILCNTLFLQCMILINRIFLFQGKEKISKSLQFDKQIEQLLQYINQNLSADLSNEILAEKFYISKYHLMHKFKKETGYTLHNYIEQKRLLSAANAILEGTPVLEAAKESGFIDYSTFLRAFRKKYNMTPTEYGQNKPSSLF